MASTASSPSPPSSSSLDEAVEPPDVFCNLGSLIVEGRMPRPGAARGCGEGPHVPMPKIHGAAGQRHECSLEDLLCKKDENFRKHMLLLWQNNVPVSIEVLLCSDCRLGAQKARSVEFSTIPEPGSILIEQWTVSVQNIKSGKDAYYINSHSLFQAVRSYLHFSQLSAWLSSSRGEEPKNILFRITIPGETFASKFASSDKPEEHSFPSAAVGRSSSVHVSVRSIPRCNAVPSVICPHKEREGAVALDSESDGATPSTSPEDEDAGKVPIGVGAVAWRDVNNGSENDLRRALVRSKLAMSAAECSAASTSNLPRSDSMDSMLGDSLLDPPQSLQKIPPKRYQSPSRCGSPSLEAPEHLLFGLPGAKRDSAYDPRVHGLLPSTDPAVEAATRIARQDRMRRRDLDGLHPRVLHQVAAATASARGPPRLSLPPRSHATSVVIRPSMPPPGTDSPPLTPEGRQAFNVPSTESSPGAASPWTYEYVTAETEDEVTAVEPSLRRLMVSPEEDEILPAPEENEEEDEEEEIVDGPVDDVPDHWAYRLRQQSPMSSRRSSTSKESCSGGVSLSKISSAAAKTSPATGVKPKKRSSLADLFDDGKSSTPPPPILNPLPVAQVFRAETASAAAREVDKCDILLGAIIRTSERNEGEKDDVIEDDETTSGNYGWQRLWRKTGESEKEGGEDNIKSQINYGITRSAVRASSGPHHCARAFETSIDNDYEYEEEDEDEEFGEAINVKTVDKTNVVTPTQTETDGFRKNFSSASAMVFHGRTRLPLTSSPAPLRKGAGSFAFDSSITSPDGVKRALFRAQSQKATATAKEVVEVEVGKENNNCSRDSKWKRTALRKRNISSSQQASRVLSRSAPASVVTTSSNLLGNFEESVLNGRLEPVSTVDGFTAEIGASGSFHPKHQVVPVTVFFYTLCDSNAVSSPYLGHINLSKKGYRVPERGTIQVTLFNPLGTVVKMFVVMYDLGDMPPNSQTFLRQRTLYMPSDYDSNNNAVNSEEAQKWLRYLIHLRFASSKSGKIYLHTDMRMIIFRKSDLDTATEHSAPPGKGYELRSFTTGPTKPKFSPRK